MSESQPTPARRCSICGEAKALEEFGPDGPGKLKCSCRGCIAARARERRAALRVPRPRRSVRFWSQVARLETGCWEWRGSLNRNGYGLFEARGLAHRVAYELAVRPIPDGLCVCHSCDNPPCCNPAHLWVGTQAENMADKKAKARISRTGSPGVVNPAAQLNDAQVREIRRLVGIPQRQIARQFGVSQSTVGRVLRREYWRHLV